MTIQPGGLPSRHRLTTCPTICTDGENEVALGCVSGPLYPHSGIDSQMVTAHVWRKSPGQPGICAEFRDGSHPVRIEAAPSGIKWSQWPRKTSLASASPP